MRGLIAAPFYMIAGVAWTQVVIRLAVAEEWASLVWHVACPAAFLTGLLIVASRPNPHP